MTTTTTATLNWGTLTTADTYSALVSTTATVPAPGAGIGVAVTSTTQTAAVTTLTAGTTYYWKVRVELPLRSNYTTIGSFIPTLVAPITPVGAAMTPAAGATAVSTTPALTWPVVAGATGYVVQLAEDPTFAILDASATTTSTFFVATEPLAYSTVYYWRVRATSATSDSAWTTGIFTTAAKPVPQAEFPEIVFPDPLPPVEIVESTIVIEQPPKTEIQIVEVEKTVPVPVTIPQPIPSYLLWTIIAIGAVLVIALIVLIVRTRRAV